MRTISAVVAVNALNGKVGEQMDMEKVIKGVHDARRYLEDREWVDKSVGVHIDALNDALALLNDDETRIQYLNDHIAMCKEEVERLHKEQEAIKPRSKVRHGANAQIQHFCGNCNTMLHGKPKFCSECGRPVLWESR